jgi:CarboxypepD_reg-like domain
MSINRLILLLLFVPFLSKAQTTTISGKVTTSVSHTGIGKVSVFLSNSSYGTETADDGSFKLVGVKPGQYTLVATSVGFLEFTQSILVGTEPISLNIDLQSKVTQLRGVVISSAADWKKNYELFKKEFIGMTENAKKCEITNPHTINMIYHTRKLLLEAWSDDFVIMENRALGYRVKFLIDTFSSSGMLALTQWRGHAVFEELQGSAEQKKIWKQKREETYYGSSRNFLKSLYSGTATQDGFIMKRLHRELDPNRPGEDVIQQKMKQFRLANKRDSFNYWVEKENMPKYYHQNLEKQPLQPYQVYQQTDQPGLFALRFTDYLYVIYTKRHEETDFKDVYHPLDMENFEASVLTLHAPFAIFDMNGVMFQGAPVSEGTWSKARLSELLPYNYAPGDDKGVN